VAAMFDDISVDGVSWQMSKILIDTWQMTNVFLVDNWQMAKMLVDNRQSGTPIHILIYQNKLTRLERYSEHHPIWPPRLCYFITLGMISWSSHQQVLMGNTYKEDVTLITTIWVLAACSLIYTSYSRSVIRGILRRSHL
jgi:hypothetical protein